MTASAANLGPGVYQGTITIVVTAPISGTVTVPVTLTVPSLPGPGPFTVSPSDLTLSGPAGTLVSGNLNVYVVSGSPIFTITTGWSIQVTPSSSTNQYTAPATIQVSALAASPGS